MAAKVFADRLAEFGINVYEVRPGIIRTEMTDPVKENMIDLSLRASFLKSGGVSQKMLQKPLLL